jgi:hypothetical protein
MTILPLYAAPQHASGDRVALAAFGGETLPRAFFASIVNIARRRGRCR